MTSDYNLNPVEIIVALSDAEALALAQFVKRASWTEARRCAVDDDEARVIVRALENVRKALAEKGYAPR
jgi:hypothetical protein